MSADLNWHYVANYGKVLPHSITDNYSTLEKTGQSQYTGKGIAIASVYGAVLGG